MALRGAKSTTVRLADSGSACKAYQINRLERRASAPRICRKGRGVGYTNVIVTGCTSQGSDVRSRLKSYWMSALVCYRHLGTSWSGTATPVRSATASRRLSRMTMGSAGSAAVIGHAVALDYIYPLQGEARAPSGPMKIMPRPISFRTKARGTG